MSSKQPAFMFYSGDWLKDPALQACSPSTRGIWINFLCHMWEAKERGILRGTVEEFCRLGRCTPEEFSLFLEDAHHHHFANFFGARNANVTDCHKKITVINRRMRKEEKARQANKKRQQQHRDRKRNANVTPYSSISSSIVTKVTNSQGVTKASQEGYPEAFEILWFEYPRKVEKVRAFKAWKARKIEGANEEDLLRAVRAYARANRETETQFIKHPATFLGPNLAYQDWLGGESVKKALIYPDCELCDNTRFVYDDATKTAIPCECRKEAKPGNSTA